MSNATKLDLICVMEKMFMVFILMAPTAITLTENLDTGEASRSLSSFRPIFTASILCTNIMVVALVYLRLFWLAAAAAAALREYRDHAPTARFDARSSFFILIRRLSLCNPNTPGMKCIKI